MNNIIRLLTNNKKIVKRINNYSKANNIINKYKFIIGRTEKYLRKSKEYVRKNLSCVAIIEEDSNGLYVYLETLVDKIKILTISPQGKVVYTNTDIYKSIANLVNITILPKTEVESKLFYTEEKKFTFFLAQSSPETFRLGITWEGSTNVIATFSLCYVSVFYHPSLSLNIENAGIKRDAELQNSILQEIDKNLTIIEQRKINGDTTDTE